MLTSLIYKHSPLQCTCIQFTDIQHSPSDFTCIQVTDIQKFTERLYYTCIHVNDKQAFIAKLNCTCIKVTDIQTFNARPHLYSPQCFANIHRETALVFTILVYKHLASDCTCFHVTNKHSSRDCTRIQVNGIQIFTVGLLLYSRH